MKFESKSIGKGLMRITEILHRSQQGITRPFFCRGEDGENYYVKGRAAGYHALCCEWVAGELARRWGLPIASFSVVEVPMALVNGSLLDDAVDLGAGPAFGSRALSNVNELRWEEVEGNEISNDLRARILIFDWWTANPDRILTPIGGNPNLLWSPTDHHLSMIDHNLAFTMHRMPATLQEFAAEHVFGQRLLQSELSFLTSKTAETPLIQATSQLAEFWGEVSLFLNEIWAGLPDEWTEGATEFTQEEIHLHLERVTRADFWGCEIEID